MDDFLFVLEWTYDSLDRILSKTNPDSNTINYIYDNQGLVGSIVEIVNVSYNEANNPLNISYDNGLVTNFSYDSKNLRLTKIKTGTKQELNYTYDHVGNVMEINDSANARLTSMEYDDLDRLTNIEIVDDENRQNNSLNFTYNEIGNLLEVLYNEINYTYVYGSPVHSPKEILGGWKWKINKKSTKN